MIAKTPGFVAKLGAALALCASTAQAGANDQGMWPGVLRNTAAIVEADVADVSYAYDEITGPRTLTRFKSIQRHRGTLPADNELTISTFGGPVPDGTFMTASDVPSFAVGSRVLVFLTNGPWFLTPVQSGFSFRVMESRGRKVLTTDGGGLVASAGLLAPEISGQAVSFENLAAGARGLELAMNAAAQHAVSVDQFIAGVDAAATQYRVAVAGKFDLVPSLPAGARWNVIPVAAPETSSLMCEDPEPGRLVCEGGAP